MRHIFTEDELKKLCSFWQNQLKLNNWRIIVGIKNLTEFKDQLGKFDIIVNGIEIGKNDKRIITLEEQKKIKKGCLIIDSAADGDGAIEGTKYTTIHDPIYEKEDKFYYVVNNAPSIFYREASKEISKSLSKNIFRKGIDYLLEEI